MQETRETRMNARLDAIKTRRAAKNTRDQYLSHFLSSYHPGSFHRLPV
jgi:hypothetical protein